jgi:uncharacterized membrane protein (UPF0127 family)
MPRNKKMTIPLLAIALVLFIIAFGAWWYLFFGKPNPPLPRVNVSVQSASSSAPASALATTTVTTTTASGAAAAAGAASNPAENPPLPAEQLSVDNVTFNVEIASTTLEETRGLSFRPSLGPTDGMLFIFGSGTIQTFWMKDMNFPLDMIWISGNTVVGFAQNAPAPAAGTQIWQLPIYSSPSDTDKVLEVNAGTVAKYNIRVGDTVVIH